MSEPITPGDASISYGDVADSARIPEWRGQLDMVRRDRIAGWAKDDDSNRPLRFRVLDNGVPLAEVVADNFRDDLRAVGVGDGNHAFFFDVPGGLAPETRHLIEVLRADDGRALNGSPYVLEATGNNAVTRNALPAVWQGNLDTVTRERIEGWAYDPRTPDAPLSLVILDNGEVLAHVLANRYRRDLTGAGVGDGRHAFSLLIPGGLSPLSTHLIEVIGAEDGCEMPGSPVNIEASTRFDAALEHAVSSAVSALAEPEAQGRALDFLITQVDRLLQLSADTTAGREARLIHHRTTRRWRSSGDSDAATAFSSAAPRRRVLVIDDAIPSADDTAGPAPIFSHMRAFQALDYTVSFAAANELSSPRTAYAALEARGIEICSSPYYASVEEVLVRQRDCFEIIYLHRESNALKYLALAREYCPKAQILYSVGDLRHVYVARQAAVERRPELLAQSRRLRFAECMAASSADAVITHSSAEAAWLRSAVVACNVNVVPWSISPHATTSLWADRRGLAFVANFANAANRDAAHYLIEDILPRIWREAPSIECLLVDDDMPEEIRRLSRTGVVLVESPADWSAIYDRVRCTIAPQRFDAGVNAGVLRSFSAGVPCLMSRIAAEGIDLPQALATGVARNAGALAAKVLELHADEFAFQTSAAAALSFIAAEYSEARVITSLEAAIESRQGARPVYSDQEHTVAGA